jgi:hypothetical protein
MNKLKRPQRKLGNDVSMKFPKVRKVVFCDVSFRFAEEEVSKNITSATCGYLEKQLLIPRHILNISRMVLNKSNMTIYNLIDCDVMLPDIHASIGVTCLCTTIYLAEHTEVEAVVQ